MSLKHIRFAPRCLSITTNYFSLQRHFRTLDKDVELYMIMNLCMLETLGYVRYPRRSGIKTHVNEFERSLVRAIYA
jgi:hypothetical protein